MAVVERFIRGSIGTLLAVVPLLSCAQLLHHPLRAPEAGGPSWTEVASEHFVVKTDFPAETAKKISANLENMFAYLAELGFASRDQPKFRVEVVYFQSAEDCQALTSKFVGGSFYPSGLHDFERAPVAILGGDFVRSTRETLQHEITHAFVNYYYPQAPPWLDEGLAAYLETMTTEDGTAIMGRPRRLRRFIKGPWGSEPGLPGEDTLLIPMSEAPMPKTLRAMTPAEFYGELNEDPATIEGQRASKAMAVHYQAAWALVHLLLTDERYARHFARYLERVHAGDPDEAAWSHTLGSIPEQQLSSDFVASLTAPETVVLRAKFEAPRVEVAAVRALGASEVDVLFARLRHWDTPEERKTAALELERAGRTAPNDSGLALVLAYAAVEEKRWADGEAVLRQAIGHQPQDARLWNALGWLLLWKGDVNGAPDGLAIASLKSVAAQLEPIARTAPELDLLARYQHALWQFAPATAYEKKALAADPNCVDCLTEVAEMLLEQDRYREALDIALMARGISAERAESLRLGALTKTLGDLLSPTGTTAADVECGKAPALASDPHGETVPITVQIHANISLPEFFHLASVCLLLEEARAISVHGEPNGLGRDATLTWRGRVPRGKGRTITLVSTLEGSRTGLGFRFDVRSWQTFDAMAADGIVVNATLYEGENAKEPENLGARLGVRWDVSPKSAAAPPGQ